MTELIKPVVRRSRSPFGHYKKRIVVTLRNGDMADDIIEMRLVRSRKTYRATFDSIFRQMALWDAGAARLKKAAERKAKRANK